MTNEHNPPGEVRSSDGLGFTAPARRVLDPCCGSRMMWFDRHNPDVVFGDRRAETVTVTDNSRGNASGQRTIHIAPDTLLDFRALFKLELLDSLESEAAGGGEASAGGPARPCPAAVGRSAPAVP